MTNKPSGTKKHCESTNPESHQTAKIFILLSSFFFFFFFFFFLFYFFFFFFFFFYFFFFFFRQASSKLGDSLKTVFKQKMFWTMALLGTSFFYLFCYCYLLVHWISQETGAMQLLTNWKWQSHLSNPSVGRLHPHLWNQMNHHTRFQKHLLVLYCCAHSWAFH